MNILPDRMVALIGPFFQSLIKTNKSPEKKYQIKSRIFKTRVGRLLHRFLQRRQQFA